MMRAVAIFFRFCLPRRQIRRRESAGSPGAKRHAVKKVRVLGCKILGENPSAFA
jgi:hypothetical protein